MVTESRWRDAQHYERSFWKGVAADAAAGNQGGLDFYQWRAGELVKRLERIGLGDLTAGKARVLEIGCGPIGLAGFFPASERVAVDPLEDFYSSEPDLVALREPSVSYRAGTGEDLPVETDSFDLVVIENCIDHCQDMDGVMADIRRALAPGGHLYLTVNSRCRPGYYVHRVLSSLKIDPGHPHTFSQKRVSTFIERSGFSVLDVEAGSFWDAWFEDLRGPGMKQRVKGMLGVSEFVVSVIARLKG